MKSGSTLAALMAALLFIISSNSAGGQSLENKPAKELFGNIKAPADLKARSIGSYSRGCLAGAQALPVDGNNWQVMRLSRNRNFGHPSLVVYLEKLARRAPQEADWRGLLVGDLAQARGGPMLTGHASHQIGLDADIWLTPMPERTLTREERETISATNVVADDWNDINPSVWTTAHFRIIRLAAQSPEVARIFVNPAIKKALCREEMGRRDWLSKVRPWYGHNYHFHIRMQCPSDSEGCSDQDRPPQGDGCGADLAWWFTDEARNPAPSPPRAPMTLAQLPQECRSVLLAD